MIIPSLNKIINNLLFQFQAEFWIFLAEFAAIIRQENTTIFSLAMVVPVFSNGQSEEIENIPVKPKKRELVPLIKFTETSAEHVG